MFNEDLIKKIAQEVVDGLAKYSRVSSDSINTGKITQQIVGVLEKENEQDLKSEIVKVCKNLYSQGFFPATSGNVSIKLGLTELLITPSGINKSELTPDQIIKTNSEGEQISGKGRVSSEIKMHLAVYKARPDIKAIVHTHPSFSTGFAAAGLALDQQVLPEAILVLGKVPLVEYGTPSTWEVPQALEKYLPDHNVFLLANHGTLALGENLSQAVHRAETLELFAKVILIARLLGGEKLLTQEQLEKLAHLK